MQEPAATLTSFLRHMTGCGQSASIDVLLRDFNRWPISYKWVVLASRWFVKLQDMPRERLAYNVWVADIELMLAGCKRCWTYRLLRTLTHLGVVDGAMWDRNCTIGITKVEVMHIRVREEVVKDALHKSLGARWSGLYTGSPRSAPSIGHEKVIHARWVLPVVDGGTLRRNSPHLKLCMSFKMLQCLARFRLGWHYLETHAARMRRRPILPWAQRTCRLCSVPSGRYYGDWSSGAGGGPRNNAVEDLRHFVLECPAYAHIRARYRSLLQGENVRGLAPDQQVQAIFASQEQSQLASCLYAMNSHRLKCLQPQPPASTTPDTGAFGGLPDAEDDVEMLRLGMSD
jgi:hypothetical protein